MKQPRFYAAGAAFAGAVLILAACSSGGSHFVPGYAVPMQMHTQSVTQPSMLDDSVFSVPNVAGTWTGTFTATASGHSASGTEKLIIAQSGSSISGHVIETVKGHSHTFNMSGTVSRTTTGARLKFTIFGQNGRNGAAHASVVGESMHGKVFVAARGTQPAVSISFKATTP